MEDVKMPDRYRDLCREVDVASTALADATRSAEKALEVAGTPTRTMRAIKPIDVVDGVELPQTIVFTDSLK